jgi:hypothetical protein
MLKKLKKRIEKDGAITVASKLGYKSGNVFLYWFKENKIPRLALPLVKELLNANK